MLELILSSVALVASLCALGLAIAFARVSPAQRLWNDLRGRVEDLEHDAEQLHARLNKRAKQETVAVARGARSAKAAVLDEAEQLLAAAAANPPPAVPKDERAALRAQIGLVKP